MGTQLPAGAPAKPVFAVPVLESVKRNKTERRVTVPEVIAALVDDGFIPQAEAERALNRTAASSSDRRGFGFLPVD